MKMANYYYSQSFWYLSSNVCRLWVGIVQYNLNQVPSFSKHYFATKFWIGVLEGLLWKYPSLASSNQNKPN
jgi:hypothetical protein